MESVIPGEEMIGLWNIAQEQLGEIRSDGSNQGWESTDSAQIVF